MYGMIMCIGGEYLCIVYIVSCIILYSYLRSALVQLFKSNVYILFYCACNEGCLRLEHTCITVLLYFVM